MELFAPAHLGVGVASAARAPVQKPPDTSRIDATDTSGKTGADARHLSQNSDNAAAARATREQKQPLGKDADRPAGPPPSFDVSLLEVEQDLKKVMARMEASRGVERDADAVKVEGEKMPSSSEQMPAEKAAVLAAQLPVPGAPEPAPYDA